MGKVKNIVMLGDRITQSGGIATLQKLIVQYASPDLNFQLIPTRDDGSIFYKGWIYARSIWLLTWTLISRPVDLVHIHISDGGSILRKAIVATIVLGFRKPILMHAHGAVFHLNYANSPKILQQLMRSIFSRCQGWIALTSFWQDFYISSLGLDPHKVFILLNPTEIPPVVPHRIGSTQIKLVFLGRIGQRKGIFDLIEAFAALPEHCQQMAELLVAGDGEIDKGRQLVQKLHLTERVRFLGLIDAQQRNALLESADVYILPTYNEGLPLALLESMSWGLPVITTPVSGIPDVVKDRQNGLIVEPGNIPQLTDALKLTILNENLRLSLGKAARNAVMNLDINSFSQRLAEIYQTVADAHEQA